MKRVLVTGASGFVARQALAPLRALGYEVHAAARRPMQTPGARWHAVDLLAPGASASLLAELAPTHLLHFAWYAEHGRFWTSAENFRWVGATLELLRAFADAGGQRAVIAGSCAEYDWHGDRACDEALTPLVPATEYGVCKNATRALFEAYCALRNLSGAWGRIFHLYGPHEHPARLVAAVARALLRDEDALCTHGRQQRDFLHVADAAEAFVALLDSGVRGAVNIGSGHAVTLADVAQRVALLAGRPQRLKLGARAVSPGDPPVLLPATRRLNEEVGWTPRYGLDAGLRETVEWWRLQLATKGEETR